MVGAAETITTPATKGKEVRDDLYARALVLAEDNTRLSSIPWSTATRTDAHCISPQKKDYELGSNGGYEAWAHPQGVWKYLRPRASCEQIIRNGITRLLNELKSEYE